MKFSLDFGEYKMPMYVKQVALTSPNPGNRWESGLDDWMPVVTTYLQENGRVPADSTIIARRRINDIVAQMTFSDGQAFYLKTADMRANVTFSGILNVFGLGRRYRPLRIDDRVGISPRIDGVLVEEAAADGRFPRMPDAEIETTGYSYGRHAFVFQLFGYIDSHPANVFWHDGRLTFFDFDVFLLNILHPVCAKFGGTDVVSYISQMSRRQAGLFGEGLTHGFHESARQLHRCQERLTAFLRETPVPIAIGHLGQDIQSVDPFHGHRDPDLSRCLVRVQDLHGRQDVQITAEHMAAMVDELKATSLQEPGTVARARLETFRNHLIERRYFIPAEQRGCLDWISGWSLS